MNLKSCPFCGSTAVSEQQGDGAIYRDRVVVCEDCGARGPNKPTSQPAIDAWNERASTTE